MTYMLTTTGGTFDLWLANPAQDISLLDIAAALAKINRWGGHTSRLYSVAEHSVRTSLLMEREHAIGNPTALMCGLMHDAHEAYTGDMGTPHKDLLNIIGNNAWHRWEANIQAQVLQRFDLAGSMREWHTHVKRADVQMLATEARDLMAPSTRRDTLITEHGPCSRELHLTPAGPYTWADWREAFIDRFAELRQAQQDMQHIKP